jgi:predicted nicotinamide N-methyase
MKYKKLFPVGAIPFPYWSQVWPSALSLAGFISDNPCFGKRQKCIGTGAGLGLPSLVAAKIATSVLCSDKEAEAVAIISQSAAHNNINNLQTAMIDWESAAPGNQRRRLTFK